MAWRAADGLADPVDFEDLPGAGGRYSRQTLVPGWSQQALARARVLVVGAGALGNEVLKNLALLGVGRIGIIDFDVVEESNLSRCVLFRLEDVGEPKARVAARRVAELNSEVETVVYAGDLLREVGAGVLEEFDLVLGCVDSIAARWRLNRLARRAGVVWIDAGIDAFCGQVASFDPRAGACYECGMTETMWARVFERNSCLMPARVSEQRPLVPTTILLTSMTAALQVQEAAAFLMRGDQDTSAAWPRVAPGERLSVRVAPYEMAVMRTRVRASCMAHAEEGGAAIGIAADAEIPVAELLRRAGGRALLLEWDVAWGLECAGCGVVEEMALPLWRVQRQQLPCPGCGLERVVLQTNRIELEAELAEGSLRELGVPSKAHLRIEVGKSAGFWCRIT